MLTEARLEQGVAEGCAGERCPQNTPAFLSWISRDAQKEATVELEATGLTWKQVAKPLTAKDRAWLLAQPTPS